MSDPTYRIVEDGRAIKCLLCMKTSWNMGDVQHRYCGNCHIFHDDTQERKAATMQKINPDSTVLSQIDGQWQKLAMFIIWKTVKRGHVKITAKDMEECQRAFNNNPILFTHGMIDGFEFSIVDEEAAKRIAEHDRNMSGRG
jgi:hypothetical protein